MADPFIRTRLDAAARDFVSPEGEKEFSNPDHYSEPRGDLVPDDDATSSGPRSLALKLVVMAIVAIALLVAIIVIFT